MNNTTLLKFTLLLFGLAFSQLLSGQITINMGNFNVDQNEEFCVDFSVEDFDDITILTFGVSWDPAVIEFTSTTNYAFGINESNFGTTMSDQGQIFLSWDDASQVGRSLDDGQILFSVCFKVIGSGGDETKIRIGNPPGNTGIEVFDNNLNNIGLTSFDAKVSVSFEEIPDNAVFVYYDDEIFSEGQSFCIPIRVRNFNNVTVLSFTLGYDQNRFVLDEERNLENWGGIGFTVINKQFALSSGEISYFVIDQSLEANGLSLEDGEVLFELCFTHLLTESCVNDEISISSNRITIEATVSDGPGTLSESDAPVIYEPGRMRLFEGEPITLDSESIFPVTCDNPDIGAIQITASGASDNLSYNWSTGETTKDIGGLQAGVYVVSISDDCPAVDTLVRSFEVITTGDNVAADAGEGMALDCDNLSVTLDGSGSSLGMQFQYDWGPIDGQTITSTNNTNQLIVDQPGRYVLTVFNSDNGCSDTDTVMVADMRPDLTVIAGEDIDFTCDDATLNLEGTGDFGINFSYAWTTEDGNITNQFSKGGITIDRPGTYVFRITDSGTGCFETDTVVVGGDNYMPLVNLGADKEITCEIATLSLSAIEDGTAETGTNYSWSSLNGTINLAQGFTIVLDREEADTYIVEARSAAGCISTDTVIVTDQRTMPMSNAGNTVDIGCEEAYVTLTGSGTSGAGYTSEWSTSDGNIAEVVSATEIRASAAGTYTYTVTETANGCTGISSVEVTGTNEKPQASVSGNDNLTCDASEIALNANSGGAAVDGFSYSWSSADGSFTSSSNTDDVDVQIDGPGTYVVRVTNDATTCFTDATLLVADARQDPIIAAGADETIECQGGSGPLTVTSDDMSNMNFSWTVVEGNGSITSGSNSSTAQYSGTGKYVVMVTNPINGCFSTDTTEILLMDNLPLAMLGDDYDHCDTETILMGNEAIGASGIWSVIAGNAALEDPSDRNCRVNSMSEGVNSFVWTLSTADCPDYSSDTIHINLIAKPNAVADMVNLTQGFGSVELDLLSNDTYDPSSDVIVTILTQPSLGVVSETSPGAYTYTLDNDNAFGTFTFDYEICDDLCSLLCDVNTVTIDVRDSTISPTDPESPTNEPLSLGITPNGDGLNDLLIFYNRWGDIVHESMPYQNDWGGTSKNGSALAQGTYYFVLQLDLGNGDIIEGDVTILQ